MKNSVENQSASLVEEKEVLTLTDIKLLYGSELKGNPSIYCGTYHKYNCGSIFGMWLDLTKFADYDEFIDVCRQLHADEEDPELMFQDYECFPRELYFESCFDEEDFDKIIEFSNLEEYEKEAFYDFLELGNDFDIAAFRDRFCGHWNTKKEFAMHIMDELYDIEGMMGPFYSYFDYEAYARDLFMDYTMSENNYVFRD